MAVARVIEVATLLLLATVVIIVAVPRASATRGQVDFQRLVGGLGTGSSVQMDGCGVSFDMRIHRHCQKHTAMLPGAALYCEQHGAGVGDLRPVGDGTQ